MRCCTPLPFANGLAGFGQPIMAVTWDFGAPPGSRRTSQTCPEQCGDLVIEERFKLA
jgi:hypothetical protein